MIVKKITDLIGNTPLLEINPEVHGLKNIDVYAKLELLSPFGSVKDKTAWNMLRHDLEDIINQSKTVIESGSGNTAKAIQMICSMHNIPFKIITNRVRVREVKQILQLLGTEIEELPGQSQCHDPSDPSDPAYIVNKIVTQEPDKYFYTTQYTNTKNVDAHYEMTGKEIIEDIGRVDYFIGGLGTTGSTRGTGKCLKQHNPQLQNIGIITTKGEQIPGIRSADEMYEVGLFNRTFYDSILEVSTSEALDSMLTLIRKCGIICGPTAGASFAGLLKYLRPIDKQLKTKHKAVFLACDRAEWYLSYIQKYRPEIFGLARRNETLNTITKEDENKVIEISPDKVDPWLNSDMPYVIIDLRGNLAFKGAHIARSINIPAEKLEDISQWGAPFSKDQKILFVCPVGEQSKKFAAYFSKLGFECVSLQGGFTAWRDMDRPIQRHMQTKKMIKEIVRSR